MEQRPLVDRYPVAWMDDERGRGMLDDGGADDLVSGLQLVHLVEIAIVPAAGDVGIALAFVCGPWIGLAQRTRLERRLHLVGDGRDADLHDRRAGLTVARDAVVDLLVDLLEGGDYLLHVAAEAMRLTGAATSTSSS